MSNPETKALMGELVAALRPVIREGVEVFDANGQPTGGRKVAPAAYFSVAQKICAADGVTATDDQASSLADEIAAATGQKFTPATPPVEDEELE